MYIITDLSVFFIRHNCFTLQVYRHLINIQFYSMVVWWSIVIKLQSNISKGMGVYCVCLVLGLHRKKIVSILGNINTLYYNTINEIKV